jgi:hypothetical protein
MRHAEAHGLAPGEFHLLLCVFDLELALGLEALDGEILELAAIGRIWDRVHAMGRESAFLLLRRCRHRQPDQH